MTRPDIASAVRAVARQAHDPAERHWRAVRKIISYLDGTKKLGLVFSEYVDADHADKANISVRCLKLKGCWGVQQ